MCCNATYIPNALRKMNLTHIAFFILKRKAMDADTFILLDENDQAFAVVSSDNWAKVTTILKQNHSFNGYQIILRGVNGGLESDDYAVLISVNDKATALKNMKRLSQHVIAHTTNVT